MSQTTQRHQSSVIVRRTRLSTVGDRGFLVAAARFWNELPRYACTVPVHFLQSFFQLYRAGKCRTEKRRTKKTFSSPSKWSSVFRSCIFGSSIFRNIGPANSGPAFFSGPPYSALRRVHFSSIEKSYHKSVRHEISSDKIAARKRSELFRIRAPA